MTSSCFSDGLAWDLLAAQRARALGVGLLSGRFGEDERMKAVGYLQSGAPDAKACGSASTERFSPAYWNWSFYLAGEGGKLQQFTLNQSNTFSDESNRPEIHANRICDFRLGC